MSSLLSCSPAWLGHVRYKSILHSSLICSMLPNIPHPPFPKKKKLEQSYEYNENEETYYLYNYPFSVLFPPWKRHNTHQDPIWEKGKIIEAGLLLCPLIRP